MDVKRALRLLEEDCLYLVTYLKRTPFLPPHLYWPLMHIFQCYQLYRLWGYNWFDVFMQDVFPVIPGDTDYRIFAEDYGDIPGLDIIFLLGGYFYHTSYDTMERLLYALHMLFWYRFFWFFRYLDISFSIFVTFLMQDIFLYQTWKSPSTRREFA